MDYKGYAALEHVFTHTRDDVFKRQTLELNKLQRKFNRLNYSHRSLIEYQCVHEPDVDYCNGQIIYDPPNHCEGCGSWAHWEDYDCAYFKFYSELSSIDDVRTWVLEMVYLCEDCLAKAPLNVVDRKYSLCTKYKLSHWLYGDEPWDILVDIVDGEHFSRTTANNWTCKFEFSYAVDNDYVKDSPMHHTAAYIIQRAFRSGWDYQGGFRNYNAGLDWGR